MSVRTSRAMAHAVVLVTSIVWIAGCEQGATSGEGNDTKTVSQTTPVTEVPVTQVPVSGVTGTEVPGTVGTVVTPVEQGVVPAPVAVPVQPQVTEGQPVSSNTTRTVRPVQKRTETAPKQSSVQQVTVSAGTSVPTQVVVAVSTDKNQVGDPVQLQVTEAVSVGGTVVIPVGSTVHGTVTACKSAGRVKGASELTIRFTEVELVSGKRYPVTCESFHAVQKGDGKESAAEIGGAAAVGGVLGGVLGGKNDVLKGTAIGAAVGTGVAVVTKGDQITLPVGRTVNVKLTSPLVVTTHQL